VGVDSNKNSLKGNVKGFKLLKHVNLRRILDHKLQWCPQLIIVL